MNMNISNPPNAGSSREGGSSPRGKTDCDRIETHWSRILYCDFLSRAEDVRISSENASSGCAGPVRSPLMRNTRNKIGASMKSFDYIRRIDSSVPGGHNVRANSAKETLVAKQDSDSDHPRSPIEMAAMLLGIFVAIYLAVGAIVQVFTPQESTASVPANRSGESAVAAPAPASQSNADESTPLVDRHAYTD